MTAEIRNRYGNDRLADPLTLRDSQGIECYSIGTSSPGMQEDKHIKKRGDVSQVHVLVFF
jgi:hypothetical protein